MRKKTTGRTGLKKNDSRERCRRGRDGDRGDVGMETRLTSKVGH